MLNLIGLDSIGMWPPVYHSLFEMLAMFTGFRLYLWLSKDSIDEIPKYSVITGCIVGAALGMKLTVWLDNPELFWLNIKDPLTLSTGKGIVGAMLGGWIGVEISKKALGYKRKTGDYFIFPLILAIAIGRLGCFFSGYYDQTYGTETTLPWAINFGDGVLRHPVQIYEIIFLMSLALFLFIRKKRPFVEGLLFQYFMTGYLSFRFLVDFIKPVPHPFFGLNAVQLLSLIALIYLIPTILKGKTNDQQNA